MGGTLVEHEFDSRGERQIGQEVIAEEFFAHIDIRLGETLTGGRQFDVAFLDLGEAKQLQGFGDREEFVDFHLRPK